MAVCMTIYALFIYLLIRASKVVRYATKKELTAKLFLLGCMYHDYLFVATNGAASLLTSFQACTHV